MGYGTVRWTTIGLLVVLLAVASYRVYGAAQLPARHISIITIEAKSKLSDGQSMEVYRWQPSTVIVRKGERIALDFYGVNGTSHPFEINGYRLQGLVVKGKRTTVTFVADKVGDFAIRCLSHSDEQHHGPMVGYLDVIAP